MKLDSRWRAVKRLGQYLGAWAIEPAAGGKLADMVQRIDAGTHLAEHGEARVDQPRSGVGRDGVAVLEIRGPVTKYGSSLSEAGSTLRMRQLVREYAADRKVKSLMLLVDSPGGTVCGTPDLADAIAKFGKPTAAYIEDCGCSAAYWIAAQCDKVYCNAAASVGSIGVYSVLVDSSAQADALGLKVHVLSTGPLKGAGVEGTVITDEQLADAQRNVDSINRLFTAAVVAGRGMSEDQVASVATGQVWIGDEAVRLGLVDGIATASQVRRDLLDAVNAAPLGASKMAKKFGKKNAAAADELKRKRLVAEDVVPPMEDDEEEDVPVEDETAMDDEDSAEEAEDMPEEEAATLKQLKAAFPDTDAAFRERCMEAGMSISQAKDAYIADLLAKLNGGKKPAAATRGIRPMTGGVAPARGSNPKDEFEARVAAAVARGMTNVNARRAVVAANPKLLEAYVDYINSGRRTK